MSGSNGASGSNTGQFTHHRPKDPDKEVKSGEAIRHNVSSLIKENRNQFTLFVISEGLNKTATARP